jgi:hypothetical protein
MQRALGSVLLGFAASVKTKNPKPEEKQMVDCGMQPRSGGRGYWCRLTLPHLT